MKIAALGLVLVFVGASTVDITHLFVEGFSIMTGGLIIMYLGAKNGKA